MHRQEPAAETSFGQVKAIAHCRLRNLSKQRVRMADQKIMEPSAPIELLAHRVRFDLQRVAANLYKYPVRHRLLVRNTGEAGGTLTSDHTDLNDLPRLSHRQ